MPVELESEIQVSMGRSQGRRGPAAHELQVERLTLARVHRSVTAHDYPGNIA